MFLTESGSLNGIGPISSRSGTIWRCGLTEVGVTLLEVYHCGVGLRSPMLKPSSVHFLPPADEDV